MGRTVRRFAARAGAAGALLWLIASVGAALGEIEYQDPTRANPIPEWVVATCMVGGALLIAMFVQGSEAVGGRGRLGPGRVLILVGASISLVPLWPFFVIGPFLVAVGFFGAAVATWTSGRRTPGGILLAIGLPLSIPSGVVFEAVGLDGEYGTILFGAVLAAGISLRATESNRDETRVASPA